MSTTTHPRSAIVTLPTDREIVITRDFAVPIGVLWEAMTRPEHVRHWFGAGHGTMTVCEIDLRVGGKWRFVQVDDNGTEHGFTGVYQEVEPPTALVSTWEYEPFPEASAVERVTLCEHDGVTSYINRVVHVSKETRDAHLAAGMEGGLQDSLDALEEIVLSS